ncbi:DUF4337 domain-containing protein [Undibacterium sp. CY18W]|uniref:DUF4337 domain-containing protein n=1 Tax=Undibacterium hunanense TaxID=2762292 RepID=A0ABR6ZXI7_9BURK|nr:DUF4337 domain-containing protein [Undibacterium hunanense]MBC3920584.1 DUF4337 domain-containing protein [Undibacterium hunanense]
MEVDPMETVEQLTEEQEENKQHRVNQHLNILVAITVALLATFMGICKVKDDNIVQAMQQSQANKIDHWAFYQARNIREEVAKATELQLRLSSKNAPAEQQAEYLAAIDSYSKLAKEQREKKEELKKQAEQDQVDYDNANYKDDQFDLSDALLAIAISLLAVTALTKQKWLYYLALVPTGFGVLMGVAGLLGLHIHPDALVAMLS